MVSWQRKKLDEILTQRKEQVSIQRNVEYSLVTISNRGKVRLREKKKGALISAKKGYIAKSSDFIYSRLSVHTGAFGIVPPELDQALITGEMPCFVIDTKQVHPNILIDLIGLPDFLWRLKQLAKGMGRVRIKESMMMDLSVTLPSIMEQKKLAENLKIKKRLRNSMENEITHQQTLVKKLRQQILQEAIEGKLTAEWRQQNPDVEPASALLARIQAEKEQLIKDKKIKKQKPLPPISDEEKPFDLPDGWEFYLLDEVTYMTRGSSPRPIFSYITDSPEGVNWIKIGDTKNVVKYIKNTQQKITQEGAKKSQRVEVGDFILSNSMSYGKPYIMAIDGYIHDGWFLIKPLGGINVDYFYYLLLSTVVQEQFLYLANGAVVKNIRAEIVKKTILPLPPLPEQKAIVAKVEKLLALCDQMETQITDSQTHSKQLMQAVLKEAFSSNSEESLAG